jgi:hypothetical protein
VKVNGICEWKIVFMGENWILGDQDRTKLEACFELVVVV